MSQLRIERTAWGSHHIVTDDGSVYTVVADGPGGIYLSRDHGAISVEHVRPNSVALLPRNERNQA